MKSRKAIVQAIGAAALSMVLASLVAPAHAESPEGCRIVVRNDIHLAPAAELATTKGYPDIVVLENSRIKVSSIPNRGRLIFDYVYKPTGHSYLYTETSPMPMKTDKGYFLEFGGYYASHPWNPRSNQPYDLEYDIVKESPKECTIRIYKEDPEIAIGFESLITIKENDPSVYVTIRLGNATKEERALDFFDRAVVALGKKMNEETRVVLPRGIDEVTLGRSVDRWMGEEGKRAIWPQPWQMWGRFEGQGHYFVDLTAAKARSIKVYDPASKESFVREWSATSPYRKAEISSWGPSYEDTLGAYPGFAITTISEGLSIPPGESRTFEVRFYASRE